MRRDIRAAMAACLVGAALLAGCGRAGQAAPTTQEPALDKTRTKVVCTSFAAYDWVRELAGDDADLDLTYLLDSGVDLHSYQPTVADVARVADADLFVYVGGESDGWVADALAAATNPDLRVVSLLDAVGSEVREEELVEGMQAEGDEGEREGEGPEYDEHVWLSLRCAQRVVGVLEDELCAVDPAHEEAYRVNGEAYLARLAELDTRYAEAVAGARHRAVVFADRFPFRYLADDHGLAYYAAFAGCSAETEASFETVTFLARKVDELGLGVVLTIEGSDGRIARTVVEATQARDQRVLVMDSLQAVTAADIEAGKTYLGSMEENLDVLSAALG